MPRPARSVGRTVNVLHYLGADPRGRHSLTAIATALGFNKATCHAMLVELASHGIVLRHPDKSYSLGPALVNLGTAATLDDEAVLDIAGRELAAIHDELNVSCMITKLAGDEIQVMVRRDAVRPLIDFTPVGSRTPCRPPAGQEFLAWQPKAVVDSWLARLPERFRDEQTPLYYDRLDDVRRLGYRATIQEDVRALKVLLHRFVNDMPGTEQLIAAVEERAYGPFTVEDYQPDLSIVTRFRAPIFDSSGRVALAMSVGPFAPHLGKDDVLQAVDRLLEGTRRVTSSLHGIVPEPDWAQRPGPDGPLETAVSPGA